VPHEPVTVAVGVAVDVERRQQLLLANGRDGRGWRRHRGELVDALDSDSVRPAKT